MDPVLIEKRAEYIISRFDPDISENPHQVKIDRLIEFFYKYDVDFEEKLGNKTVGGLFSLTGTVLCNGVSISANTMVIDKRYESENKEVLCNTLMAFLLAHLIITQATLEGMPQECIGLDFDRDGAMMINPSDMKRRVCLDVMASALLVPRSAVNKLLDDTRMVEPEIGYSGIIRLIMSVFHVTYNLAVFRYNCIRCIEMDKAELIGEMSFTELGEGI